MGNAPALLAPVAPPGLLAAARHRTVDHIRRTRLQERKHEELGRELAFLQESTPRG